MESVRHKIAPRICPAAEIDKNFPMTRSGREKMHRFSGTKILDKFQRQRQRARLLENLRMRDDHLSLLLARRRGFFGYKKR